MEKTFESLAQELQLEAIDQALLNNDFNVLSNQLNQLISEIVKGITLFDTKKQEYNTIGAIRDALKKDSIDLTNLGLKGYYFIEKYKEHIANKEFTYTLAAQKGEKSGTIQRADHLSLKEMILFIGQVQKTRSSAGSNAILSGSISSKKLIEFGFKSTLTDDQIILYKKMYEEGRKKNLKKGIIYEAFEHALAKGATSKTRNFNSYFAAASGNIPFYKFAGDVKGEQVKFGGFTLAHISTIITVLQYMQMIFMLIKANRKNLAKKLENIVFKQTTTASTTAKKLYDFIFTEIKGDLREELLKIQGLEITLT